MLSSTFARLSLLTGVALLAACSSSADPDAASETAEGAQTACLTGITLPDLPVYGNVVNDPVVPKKSVGLSLGVLDERAPTVIDPPAMVSYAEATGLRRKGWTFAAKRGERFSVGSFTSQSVTFEVFGPIESCHAGATDVPAPFEGIHGWRAPANGTFLVTAAHTLSRDAAGVIHPYPNPEASYPGVLAIRRLLADDTPAGHAFVESAPLPMLGASEVAVRTLAGEAKPALLMIGVKLPATNGAAAAQTPSLVVVRQNAEPLYFPQCKAGLGGIVAGDFDGDGRTDVLSGTNLFKGMADGGFTCEPSGLVVYEGKVMGPIDVDGDGAMDVLAVAFNGVGSSTTTNVFVTPHFRRGPAFVAGALRRVAVPLGTTFDGTRSTFLDVTGDGKPEIVASLIDPTNPAASNDDKLKVVAFSTPIAVPQDASPPDFDAPSIPLLQVVATPSLTPDPWEVDNRGSRLFDADGDGLRDRILARTTYSYAGFGLAYGAPPPAPPGTFRTPWDVSSMNNFGSRVILEHLDYDGDGCEDVLVAGYGMRLFRGVRCVQR